MKLCEKKEEIVEKFAEENLSFLEKTLEELVQIPAPSYKEEARRSYCERWLDQFEIEHQSDEEGNLLIPYQIREGKENVMIVAHMDTVFDENVPLHLKKEGEIWKCPGIGDNTSNVVLILLLAKFLKEYRPEFSKGIWLAVDTCEEGLGNLAGSRALMREYGDKVCGVLAVDLYRDKIYTGCIGSVRYEITAKTPGGHSFADFGTPNAIWVLSELVTRLYQYQTEGCTTYNVGMIGGGTSVNTIAQEASMLFEYRSDSASALRTCKSYLEKCLEEAKKTDQVTIQCRVVGERPCMEKVDENKIEEVAEICCKKIKKNCGVMPQKAKASTDCNIPLSLGIPAVCAGFFRGGGAHTREEWLDISTAESSLRAILEILAEIGR
ncbi:MAG: M20/M25/M40 family metallo-hydrolase [Lachnospiraceae bacterium]|nr:M20/M25/M40 family metallo-hydrolase [Robinsoniella sp.]MDY3767626.1 M20/M25/M40 family metallo-hydrolase [Lachnospiraceae bacterium]